MVKLSLVASIAICKSPGTIQAPRNTSNVWYCPNLWGGVVLNTEDIHTVATELGLTPKFNHLTSNCELV